MGDLKVLENFIAGYFRGWANSSAFLLSLTIVLSSCGGSSNKTSTPPTLPSVTISANPNPVTAGDSTTLTVTATNATQVVLTDNVGDPAHTFPTATGGTYSVKPTANVTYTATATGSSGATATNTLSVTVNGPAPSMTLFTVDPTTMLAGQPVTLTWASSSNTQYVVINANVGFSPGRVATSGTGVSVNPPPTQTTTYTAIATSATGQQSTPLTATVTVSPVTSFDGLDSDEVTGGAGQTDIDPYGAVGTKQFMEYVNNSYQAYDKITQQPIYSTPQLIGTPWTASQCAGTSIQLDAVIIFDRLASRWVIAGKATRTNHYYFCIAVSSSDDLTSSTWYSYDFQLDPNPLGANSLGHSYLPDWPKLGTWWNAYWAGMDKIDPDTLVESGAAVCAFDRTLMLSGATQTPQMMQCVSIPGPLSAGVYLGHSLIPADVDGTTAPPANRDEFMVSIQNPTLGVSPLPTTTTAFNLWDFASPTWTASPLTYTLTSVTVPAYTPGCYLYDTENPAITNCVPEPAAGGVGQHIDSVGDRFMPRFAYRNFASVSVPYESFLISTTVQSPPNGQPPPLALQTGISWYELRGSGTPTVFQQGLITPDISYFRFLPSIAQDKLGNAAVGYSVSSPLTDPGINASYWNLGGGSPTEVTLLTGTQEEVTPGTGAGQWGSYSGISVDPTDDCTFWYVNEYWGTDSSLNVIWKTNISNFALPGCQ